MPQNRITEGHVGREAITPSPCYDPVRGRIEAVRDGLVVIRYHDVYRGGVLVRHSDEGFLAYLPVKCSHVQET